MSHRSVEIFIKKKKQMKKQLAEHLSFSFKRPLMAVVLDRELSEKEEENLKNILKGTAEIEVQVVIVADTNLEAFSEPHTIVMPYGRSNRKKLLEAADMALTFSFSDVEEMLLNGTIPISCRRSEVDDYNPNRESGNGFIYKEAGYWSIFAALIRALETFKFPYDWSNIVRQGRESVGREV